MNTKLLKFLLQHTWQDISEFRKFQKVPRKLQRVSKKNLLIFVATHKTKHHETESLVRKIGTLSQRNDIRLVISIPLFSFAQAFFYWYSKKQVFSNQAGQFLVNQINF